MNVSIIMTALDEPYINRTIDDIVDKSGSMLKEIIVIDDCSKEKVESDSATVIRNSSRKGLIWGRNYATDLAKSEVVISIDPHSSVTRGWLEAMCDILQKKPKSVVTPKTWMLNPELWTINRKVVGRKTRWDWSLNFDWFNSPGDKTPSIAGHCFAFKKDWWEKTGRFDDSMKSWGGENIEFALKTWLCGGQVLIGSCFVSHWFKEKFQYDFPDWHVRYNKCRVAEVWLDGYKDSFYKSIGKKRGSINFGDLRERLAVKARMQERSIEWYINNLQPELRTT
jgi:polypeptide N-acetylgalactosaminyltransferase